MANAEEVIKKADYDSETKSYKDRNMSGLPGISSGKAALLLWKQFSKCVRAKAVRPLTNIAGLSRNETGSC